MQKRIVFSLLILLFFTLSCKKTIEKKKENAVIEAMTVGRWLVQEYKAAGNNVTTEFTGYEFQFHEDGKVDGILSSTTTTGTWVGDLNQMTISSSFPTSALPLSRLNAVWKIINTDWTFVYAYNTNGTDSNYLKLQKK